MSDLSILTDSEYDLLYKIADLIREKASKGLGPSLNPEFDRIYPKGFRNGFAAALAEFPEAARALIAKHQGK